MNTIRYLSNSTVSRAMVDFTGKLCLAPMVRSGELPTRLMALKYGADLVWSPEIVDKKMVKCNRLENKELGTIDYTEIDNAKKVVFRTYPASEKGRLIFQMGSADPEIAVQAGLKVINDVDGIDLNCGCPKPFSTHSGMGAALLSKPDLLEQILRNLIEKIGKPYHKPISCKIRLMDEADPTPSLQLIRRLCKTGISNLTLHCRTRPMRNRELPIRTFLPEIIKLVHSHRVNFIINGGIKSRKDFEELQQLYGGSIGGMIAESAESNPTVFSSQPLPYNKVIPEFIQIAENFDNNPSNTKYIILNQLPGKSKFYQKFCRVQTHKEFLEIANEIGDEGNKILLRYLQKDKLVGPDEFHSSSLLKERLTNDYKKRKSEGEHEIDDETKKQRNIVAPI